MAKYLVEGTYGESVKGLLKEGGNGRSAVEAMVSLRSAAK
jgi:hypothetical protein